VVRVGCARRRGIEGGSLGSWLTSRIVTSHRKEREQQFVKQDRWGHYALSYDLTFCADHMLEAALHERREEVYRLARSHYTSYAIGAIVLAWTAFDSFLNEVCDFRKTRTLVANTTTIQRFIGLLPPGTVFDRVELEKLVVVRNEIIHYLPRPIPEFGHIAAVLEDLDRRGLLMTTPKAPGWEIPQRLASYALAFWAFETIEAAVAGMTQAAPRELKLSLALAPNFGRFRHSACSPDMLPLFDKEFGLKSTEEL
jgi:hypothetical protein